MAALVGHPRYTDEPLNRSTKHAVFFDIENLALSHVLIRALLMATGLYWRGISNAAKVGIRHNSIGSPNLPEAFDGFTIVQLSDLHVEMSEAAMERVIDLLGEAHYDICVLTGDYRGRTYGPYDTTLAGMDNIEKAAVAIPHDEFSILISHTPEVYRQAARADFNLLLSGHTHGGQICLPGGIPIKLDSVLPRSMGSGLWKYHDMLGYTSLGAGSSVVPVRFNCPPEITLHHFHLSS